MKSHRKLDVWRGAIRLTIECYQVARRLPRDERYALADQLRRAAVSVAACIAEGHGSGTRREYAYRVSLARSSLAEVDTHLVIAHAVGHVPAIELKPAFVECERVGQMLTKLHQSLKRKPRENAPP